MNQFEELVKKRFEWLKSTESNGFEFENILSGLYNDDSHFIYELMQNAEDAGATEIHFELLDEELIVKHNGRDFNYKDIDGITGIGKTTKKESLTQIGKFGIGFKSVFAISKTPEVHSGQYSIRIKQFVLPELIKPKHQKGETLFRFPFDSEKKESQEIYYLIRKRLANLGVTNLLFLTSISSLHYKIRNGDQGKYVREMNKTTLLNCRKAYLLHNSKNGVTEESYLLFHRPVTGVEDRMVQIAYKLEKNKKGGEIIVPVLGSKLFAFFATEKETHLEFLIQAPYRTTPARDNIPFDEPQNIKMINETSELVVDSIFGIKRLGFLTVNFLKILPIDKKYSEVKDNAHYSLFYSRIKKLFKGDDALIPVFGGGFESAANIVIAENQELRKFITPKQIQELFDIKNMNWMDGDIALTAYSELRRYLNSEVGINIIDPIKFARKISEEYIEKQSDEWMRLYYSYLVNLQYLFNAKSKDRDLGPLRYKPIIRMEDGSHAPMFKKLSDKEDRLNVFFPSPECTKDDYHTIIAKNIVSDSDAKLLFSSFGVRTLNPTERQFDRLLELYRSKTDVSSKKNKEDVEWLHAFLKKVKKDAKYSYYLNELRGLEFLMGVNAKSGKEQYKAPKDLFAGSKYSKTKALQQLYKGNSKVWFLHERYSTVIEQFLLGELDIYSELSDVVDNLGFRYIDETLSDINIEQSVILWELLKNYADNSRVNSIVYTLTVYNWLPNSDGDEFFKPSEIKVSDLFKKIDTKSEKAQELINLLNFQEDTYQHIVDQLDEDDEEQKILGDLLSEFGHFSKNEKQVLLGQLLKYVSKAKKKKENQGKEEINIHDLFQSNLAEGDTAHTEKDPVTFWKELDPEQEKDLKKTYGELLFERIKESQIKLFAEIRTRSAIVDSVDPKEYLLAEYEGMCQICNTQLNMGKNIEPYYEVFRIIETRNKNAFSDMEFNILCLCPNCHAILKHGHKNLSGINKMIDLYNINELPLEEIEQRNGAYYTGKIIRGDELHDIYFSQDHFVKINEFLNQTKSKT